jgi:hemoglobin-like flavoprotein
MNPDQVKLVQASFAKLQPMAPEVADLFYARLFAMAPNLRELFAKDMDEQKKKFTSMLATAVAHLHQIDKVVFAVQELGRRHAQYGVKDTHYTIVGEALIWTLCQSLGPAFTTAVRDAWIAAYTALATVMKEAARAQPTTELAETR